MKNCNCACCGERKEYTLQDALELARNLIYGVVPKASDPMPTIKQAITAIENPIYWTFNWLTGQKALEVLRKAL